MSDDEEQASVSHEEGVSEEESAVETTVARHRRELKELQSRIQGIKRAVPKGDKKRAKAAKTEIGELEAETAARHTRELAEAAAAAAAADSGASTATCTRTGDGGVDDDGAGAADEVGNEEGEKKSRAQKRREKKERERFEQQERIRLGIENAGPSKRDIERQALVERLRPQGLRLETVDADGHCLYKAIACQLQGRYNWKELRQLTANHIRSHKEDFVPFLTDPNGDPLDENGFSEYCDRIENTAEWGGHPEITAMSGVLDALIRVHRANAPTLDTGASAQPLLVQLAFHSHELSLGAHYNAVLPLD